MSAQHHRLRPQATARTTALAQPAVAREYTTGMLILLSACLIMLLSGCVGQLPGGSDNTNKSYYQSNAELKDFVNSLQTGMTKAEVFARLGRRQDDFKRLNRSELVGTLFGGEDAGIPIHFTTEEDIMKFLESLEGYRIDYKGIKRRHGLSSPIRIQTDANGFDYSISLIFKDGILYQKPFLSGGLVNTTSTKTLFDYLNPGMLLGIADN